MSFLRGLHNYFIPYVSCILVTLLAEASPWFKLRCNNLASEIFPVFLFLGPVIYSRNACNDVGNQAEYVMCSYWFRSSHWLFSSRYRKNARLEVSLGIIRSYQFVRAITNCWSLLNFRLAIKYLFILLDGHLIPEDDLGSWEKWKPTVTAWRARKFSRLR